MKRGLDPNTLESNCGIQGWMYAVEPCATGPNGCVKTCGPPPPAGPGSFLYVNDVRSPPPSSSGTAAIRQRVRHILWVMDVHINAILGMATLQEVLRKTGTGWSAERLPQALPGVLLNR